MDKDKFTESVKSLSKEDRVAIVSLMNLVLEAHEKTSNIETFPAALAILYLIGRLHKGFPEQNHDNKRKSVRKKREKR